MALQAMTVARTLGMNTPPIMHGQEAASQSYVVGALLVNSSGKLAVATADPTLATVVGLALTAATGTTDTDVSYVPILPGVIFEANLDDGSGTLVSAVTHLNAQFGIAVTSGKFWIDQSDTTNIRVCVIGFRDAIGTVNARAYCIFLPGAAPYTKAAA
jgi:hypothetical protein